MGLVPGGKIPWREDMVAFFSILHGKYRQRIWQATVWRVGKGWAATVAAKCLLLTPYSTGVLVPQI